MDITFKTPQFFILFALLPLIFFILLKYRKRSSLRFSSFAFINRISLSNSFWFKNGLIALRLLAISLVIIALARPQLHEAEREFETEGVDIIIALDISGSMMAEDFQPANRLEVAKEEAIKFIQGRKNDRIGLVIFAQQSITQCPLTTDYNVLIELLDTIHIGLLKDGTAVGLAIANAVNRLRNSKAKSKVVILLTDGENNSGQIDPLTAAELAKMFNIKIYTIGIGKGGMVPYPVDDPLFGRRYTNVEVKIDEETLIKIADLTDGLYFRSHDQKSLERIYEKIDQLEKTEIKVTQYVSYLELFTFFIYPALFLLLFEYFLVYTIFMKIP